MKHTRGVWKSRTGVALLMVLMMGLLAFVAVTALLGMVAPRSCTVQDSAASDRSLALAERFADQLLDQINGMQELPKSSSLMGTAADPVIAQMLSTLNGGDADTDSLTCLRQRVRTCVTDVTTSRSYRVDDATFVKGVLTGGRLMAMDDGSVPGLLAEVDPLWATDHRWFQIDTNCDYWPSFDSPDVWRVRVTAFNIAVPELRRTVELETGAGLSAAGGAPNWYRRSVGPGQEQNFSDYAAFFNSSASFGPYDVTSGPIRSNGDLSVSGWAQAPVQAHGVVTDGSSRSGRFSVNKWGRTLAAQKGYVRTGYPAADWTRGKTALSGTDPARSVLDTGVQDQCLPAYTVSGDATIVFSVDETGAGRVTINQTTREMPSNGLIFVDGNAWVGGTVHGRCTLGCTGTISIQDDIVYATAPRVNSSDPMPSVPDALGLIAGEQVFIPRETYDTHRQLRVDAAIFSCAGGLQIDPASGTHRATLVPHYEAFWNGSQALCTTSDGRAPLVSVGGEVRGYELEHVNYDWNLKDYGPPPLFPATGTKAVEGQVTYTLLSSPADDALLSRLAGLTPTALSTSAADYDPQFATSFAVLDGIRYYTPGPAVVQYARYCAQQNPLSRYRASWKEQIAAPVRP